jgi:hypothetical protein
VLRERLGAGLRIHVRSRAPEWLFTRRDPRIRCEAAPIDAGVVQPSGLEHDRAATLAAHRALLGDWEARVATEAAWLLARRPGLVLGDVPPLAFEAARRAGVPGLALANFAWDWVLEPWADDQPGFRPVVARYADAYARAETLFRLPLHGAFPSFRHIVDVPLVVHRARRSRTRIRAALGIPPDDGRPLVLVSFGGFGSGHLAPPSWDALANLRFVSHAPAPPGFPAPWTRVSGTTAPPHEELVAGCDVVIGKPGYGTCAEVLAHGQRFLHLPREDFREVAVLEAGLRRHPAARQLPREDFFGGRWRHHLESVLALPAPVAPWPADGADRVADTLLARLGWEAPPAV